MIRIRATGFPGFFQPRPEHAGRDIGRTRLIEAHGYRVIRFWNNEVMENIDGVLQTIAQELALARNR